MRRGYPSAAKEEFTTDPRRPRRGIARNLDDTLNKILTGATTGLRSKIDFGGKQRIAGPALFGWGRPQIVDAMAGCSANGRFGSDTVLRIEATRHESSEKPRDRPESGLEHPVQDGF